MTGTDLDLSAPRQIGRTLDWTLDDDKSFGDMCFNWRYCLGKKCSVAELLLRKSVNLKTGAQDSTGTGACSTRYTNTPITEAMSDAKSQ